MSKRNITTSAPENRPRRTAGIASILGGLAFLALASGFDTVPEEGTQTDEPSAEEQRTEGQSTVSAVATDSGLAADAGTCLADESTDSVAMAPTCCQLCALGMLQYCDCCPKNDD